MTSIERFVLADGITKRAWGEFAKGFFGGEGGSTAGNVAGLATDFLPVVGGVKQLGQAAFQASQGNWGKALSNTGFGALGLIGAGAIGKGLKGVGMLSRLGKPLGAMATKAAPTLAPALGKGVGRLGAAIGAPGNFLGKQLTKMPVVGRGVSAINANPGKTLAGGYVAGTMGNKLNDAAEIARQGDKQNVEGMQNMLSDIHQNPVFNNPLYSGGGRNPNYADVNPSGMGAPEQPSGMQMAGQLLGPALHYFTGQ